MNMITNEILGNPVGAMCLLVIAVTLLGAVVYKFESHRAARARS